MPRPLEFQSRVQRDAFDRIFSGEESREQSSKELLHLLCSPGGMDTFLRFKRTLGFRAFRDGNLIEMEISSSMSERGDFITDAQGKMGWRDEKGRENTCISVLVSLEIGDTIRDLYKRQKGEGIEAQ